MKVNSDKQITIGSVRLEEISIRYPSIISAESANSSLIENDLYKANLIHIQHNCFLSLIDPNEYGLPLHKKLQTFIPIPED